VRDDDGLALSSRNQYLSAEQRKEAPRLYQTLSRIRDELVEGSREFQRLEFEGMANLARHGWRLDYIAVRRQADLQPPEPDDTELVVVAAARLAGTRLIDNVEVTSKV
jgi:pantoate--beta-alanine ligase